VRRGDRSDPRVLKFVHCVASARSIRERRGVSAMCLRVDQNANEGSRRGHSLESLVQALFGGRVRLRWQGV